MTARLVGVEKVPWRALRCQVGKATQVPQALRVLASADQERAVKDAYWSLDNAVVVQGDLFEAAPEVVPFLFQLLEGGISDVSRTWVYELLLQLAIGHDGADAGVPRGTLRARCQERLHDGIKVLAAEVRNEKSRFRVVAAEILAQMTMAPRGLIEELRALADAEGNDKVTEALDVDHPE